MGPLSQDYQPWCPQRSPPHPTNVQAPSQVAMEGISWTQTLSQDLQQVLAWGKLIAWKSLAQDIPGSPFEKIATLCLVFSDTWILVAFIFETMGLIQELCYTQSGTIKTLNSYRWLHRVLFLVLPCRVGQWRFPHLFSSQFTTPVAWKATYALHSYTYHILQGQ